MTTTPPHNSSRPAPDDDPARLRKMLRHAPAQGDVVDRRRAQSDDDGDEGPSAEDIERFGDVTQKCPSCGREVFDDTDICYHCGHAISKAAGAVRSPMWAIITVGILLMAFAVLLLRGFF